MIGESVKLMAFVWEILEKYEKMTIMKRAKVPGEWFVRYVETTFFYPDPQHVWDGSTLPQ